jgi:probable F420-dependent oxidoreductase
MKFIFPVPNLSRLKAVARDWEPSVTTSEMTRMAKRAEQLGYDMLRVAEHLVVPHEHVELSGAHYMHSVAAQGYFLGATENIRMTTSVTILPLQHPVAMAKALSTIDWLSNGRVTIGVGVGWIKGEFDALGVPFEKRGRIMDEYLAAMIELWTKDRPQFEGEFVSFKDVAFEPRPVQTPHIPIWIGGDSDAALKRAARFGAGWNPYLTKPDDFLKRLDFIKSQPTYKGGPFDVMYNLSSSFIGEGHVEGDTPVGKSMLTAQEMIDIAGWLKARGVTVMSFPIPPVKDGQAYLDYAQWFMEEVKPKLN